MADSRLPSAICHSLSAIRHQGFAAEAACSSPPRPAQSIFCSTRKAVYFSIACAPVTRSALSASQLSGFTLTYQPAPYGSALRIEGLAFTSALAARMVPERGAVTGPTHLPLSTVPALLPFFSGLPASLGVAVTMPPAKCWAASVIPTVTVPSASGRAQTCFSGQRSEERRVGKEC